jgi:hypothetical protein
MVCQRVVAAMSLVIFLMNVAGCATIVHGQKQDIPLTSSPDGATVKADGKEVTTPGQIALRRKSGQDLVFTKEGFPQRSVTLESEPSWWLLGNALFGGIIGLIVDLVGSGGYKLAPESVDMDMATGNIKEVPKETIDAIEKAEEERRKEEATKK